MENRKVVNLDIENPIKENEIPGLSEFDRGVLMKSLAALDPDLWLIRSYLDRYDVNPAILLTYIEHLGRINEGSGWGKINTDIRDHKVAFCEGTDSRLLDLEIKAPYN